MFWSYLWQVFNFSWFALMLIYLIYFLFGIIANRVNSKTQTESSYVSLIGISNEKSNTLFYAPIFIVLFAAGMSINSNVLKWVIIAITGVLLLSDFLHMIIEIISFLAIPGKEKSHVLLYTLPALIALFIWSVLGYDMLKNFRLIN